MQVEPGWFLVGFTMINAIFMAGVFFGGFVPLRGQVEKLADKIESAAMARETHTAALTEIKTVVSTVQEEVRRLRDGRNDDHCRNMAAIAETLLQMGRAIEKLTEAK